MAFQIRNAPAQGLTLVPTTGQMGCVRWLLGSFGLLGLGGTLLYYRHAMGSIS